MKRKPVQESKKEDRETYLGVAKDSPLRKACKQVFEWHCEERLIVILWNDSWLWGGDENHWKKLFESLSSSEKARLLIAIGEETPDMVPMSSRHALRALLRAIAEDTKQPKGWACLTDFGRLVEASVVWEKSKDSALLRLCDICSRLKLPEPKGTPMPTLSEFVEFLATPEEFRLRALHDKREKAKEDVGNLHATEGLRNLKWLDVMATCRRSMKLNVLVVENKADDLIGFNDRIGETLDKLLTGGTTTRPLRGLFAVTYFLVSSKDGFEAIRDAKNREHLKAILWNPEQPESAKREEKEIPWPDIDLVLQDIVLEEASSTRGVGLTGLDLAPHYYEACPHALVFLLTSLDVESLVGSGGVDWRYVDCVLSKPALASLWHEYRRCFQEKFGRMFWPDWNGPLDDDERKQLRSLFGSLRRWQIEPDILWHGQTLPEMIDHAHRHISALWKLCNDFIGTLMENSGAKLDVLSLRHRIAFAVAVWMHDVGHRGDEHVAGSMDIRASHAGISERLLLRNPVAYQLDWMLKRLPHQACSKHSEEGRTARLECRNQTTCSTDKLPLCLLREAGLLCRHHQSNAPLDGRSLHNMATRGKEPAVYSLVPDDVSTVQTTEEFLRGMANEALPMPSPRGTKVRLLEEFETSDRETFRSVAGLLRMLDALQLHRSRVGTAASRRSFEEFLENRFEWCRSERVRLEGDRRAATPGRRAFQRASARLAELDEYEILLRTQVLHHWRQAVVHDVKARWSWDGEGRAKMQILFTLNEAALNEFDEAETQVPDSRGEKQPFKLKELFGHKPATDAWIESLETEVIGSEHKSQYHTLSDPVNRTNGYLGALQEHVDFAVGVVGTDQKSYPTIRLVEPKDK